MDYAKNVRTPSITTYNLGCRCDECKKAMRDYHKKYSKRPYVIAKKQNHEAHN